MKFLKCVKISYIALSAIFIALGLCLIILPGISAVTISMVIGIACIIYGAIKLMGYFSKDQYHLTFQFDLALGIVTVIVGIVLLFHPEDILSFMPTVIGLFVLIDSVFKLQTAFDAKKFGMNYWWLILILSIISALFGIVLFLHPFNAVKFVMQVMGISLTVNGIQNLCTAAYTVKVAKRTENKKFIDVDD